MVPKVAVPKQDYQKDLMDVVPRFLEPHKAKPGHQITEAWA